MCQIEVFVYFLNLSMLFQPILLSSSQTYKESSHIFETIWFLPPPLNGNYFYSLIIQFNHSGFYDTLGSQYLSKQGKVFMQSSLVPLPKFYSFISLLAPLLVAIFLESLGVESVFFTY